MGWVAGGRGTCSEGNAELWSLVREPGACPPSTACLRFSNFTRDTSDGWGAPLALDVVDGADGGRTPVYGSVGYADCGPTVPPFVFNQQTCEGRVPVPPAGTLRLSLREADAGDPLLEVGLADAGGGTFSLWVVGRSDAGRRLVYCRDDAAPVGDFSDCDRAEP